MVHLPELRKRCGYERETAGRHPQGIDHNLRWFARGVGDHADGDDTNQVVSLRKRRIEVGQEKLKNGANEKVWESRKWEFPIDQELRDITSEGFDLYFRTWSLLLRRYRDLDRTRRGTTFLAGEGT